MEYRKTAEAVSGLSPEQYSVTQHSNPNAQAQANISTIKSPEFMSMSRRANRGGLRYCINSSSLRFVHRANMEAEGYGAYLNQVEDIQ